jgi:acetoin utilization protein AcuC
VQEQPVQASDERLADRAARAGSTVAGPLPDEPLVIYGAASHDYDFGPGHPFTPRRFGPGIDLLRSLGATRFQVPMAASDADLASVHDQDYVATIRMLSDYPEAAAMAGFDSPDTPPFYGMHEAGATVVGGTLTAMDAILAGEVTHAFHPGGGLHHAMPGKASGFCVYNDLAVAIRRARQAGHRVLYVDFDVHHGDGVEAIFWSDPHVLTVSFHETGLVLFPGSGFVEERGGPQAEGSAINIPLEPGTSDESWLAAIELVVPQVAAAFRPTVLVSLHGADSHVLDPLAHLEVTTSAMLRAARLLDGVAHEHADGRWLATGGGGYDVYRVVPRAWALTWFAQAHLPVPNAIPPEWRERWAAEATRYGQAPLPEGLLDPPGITAPEPAARAAANLATARRALEHSLHVLAQREPGGRQ